MNLPWPFSKKPRTAPAPVRDPGVAATSVGPAPRDGWVTTADGLKVHYLDYAGPADRTPVLCLHGLTRNVRDFGEVAPRLQASGRRVLVAEMRGRGRSDWDPQPDRYRPDVYVGDMLRLLDQERVERAVIVGTSMGGLMAMMMGLVARDRIAAVVLNDIGPVIQAEGLARIQGYVGGGPSVVTWADAADKARSINGSAFPGEADNPAFWDAFARRLFTEGEDGRPVLDYDPAISGKVQQGDVAPPDLWPAFDSVVDAPMLLVRGAITDLLSTDTVAEMQRRKPDLEVVEAANVGHAPMLTEPDVRPALERFVAAQP